MFWEGYLEGYVCSYAHRVQYSCYPKHTYCMFVSVNTSIYIHLYTSIYLVQSIKLCLFVSLHMIECLKQMELSVEILNHPGYGYQKRAFLVEAGLACWFFSYPKTFFSSNLRCHQDLNSPESFSRGHISSRLNLEALILLLWFRYSLSRVYSKQVLMKSQWF